VSVGYIYDFPETHGVQFGFGGLGSVHFLPSALDDVYGDTPASYMIFARARWGKEVGRHVSMAADGPMRW
jgi:hypothetical protein